MAQSTSSNSSKHRVLIVGVGSIGERHLRCFQATGRAEVGLCEPNAELRQQISRAYGVASVYAGLDEALKKKDAWDSAVIATPANTHVDLAVQALEAGIAPLIEKPLSVSGRCVAPLHRAADLAGLPVGVAFVYRAHAALAQMRQAILDQRFGRALQVVVVAGQHFPTYRPAYAQTYYADRATGGGAVQDGLSHLINAVEWILGPTTRVVADALHLKLADIQVEDTVHVLARNGNTPVSYCLNQHQAPNETTLTVVCERGTARCEFHRHAWRCMTEPESAWQDHPVGYHERDDWFIEQEQAWLNVLDGRGQPLCSLDQAEQTLMTTRAILASAQADGGWTHIESEVAHERA